jgi:hypothetical protein
MREKVDIQLTENIKKSQNKCGAMKRRAGRLLATVPKSRVVPSDTQRTLAAWRNYNPLAWSDLIRSKARSK